MGLPALVRSTSTGILVNDGHLLENLVFVDRRRRGNEVYYYRTRSGREVDFVWRGGDGRLTLAQVCFRAAEGSETLARELTALREALEEQPGSRAVLVTMDDEHRHVKTASGIVFELRYIRDTQKREVDFVVIETEIPGYWLKPNMVAPACRHIWPSFRSKPVRGTPSRYPCETIWRGPTCPCRARSAFARHNDAHRCRTDLVAVDNVNPQGFKNQYPNAPLNRPSPDTPRRRPLAAWRFFTADTY